MLGQVKAVEKYISTLRWETEGDSERRYIYWDLPERTDPQPYAWEQYLQVFV